MSSTRPGVSELWSWCRCQSSHVEGNGKKWGEGGEGEYSRDDKRGAVMVAVGDACTGREINAWMRKVATMLSDAWRGRGGGGGSEGLQELQWMRLREE